MIVMNRQVWAIKETQRKRIKQLCPELHDKSGIYVWTRTKVVSCYVGQAKHIIDRSISHLMAYDHLGLSLKKYGLYDKDKNPQGWKLDYYYCDLDELDIMERYEIKKQQELGRELYNITSGGQCVGKEDIAERKAGKNYHDGLKQGYENCLNEIREYFSKYLDFVVKEPILNKKGRPFAVKSAKYEKFSELMKGKSEENDLQKEN